MKSFKNILETVYIPKDGPEKKFWDKHTVNKRDYPNAAPGQFTSDKKKAKRLADRTPEEEERVYEAATLHTKRADKEAIIVRAVDPNTGESKARVIQRRAGEIKIGEEVDLDEKMDPVGKHDADIDNDGDTDKSDKYLIKRRRAIARAIDEGHGVFLKSGSFGAIGSKPIEVHANIEDAEKQAKRLNSYLSTREKKKHGLKYHVKPVAEGFVVVDLDEVSDQKLDAYRRKAFDDQPAGDDGSDKYRKRKFGRDLAFAKQTGRAKVLATNEEVEDLDEAYFVTRGSVLTHDKPFKTSAEAIRHANREENSTMRTHTVHHIVDGKIKKQWQYSAASNNSLAPGGFTPYYDNKGEEPRFTREEVDLEEVENLDEVSKEKLGSYIKKAAMSQIGNTATAIVGNADDAATIRAKKRLGQRNAGIARATDRLTREEADLDETVVSEGAKPNQYIEVTNKFTGSKSYHEVHPTKAFAALNHHNSLYGTKAARIVSGKEAQSIKASKVRNEEWHKDEKGLEYPFSKPFESKQDAHAFAKNSGLGRSAVKSRPTGWVVEKPSVKESTYQIDEAFKVGAMHLEDGSSMTLTREDVDMLNNLFNQLNSSNRAKMEQRLKSSKNGFNEIISFAKEI